MWALAIDHRDSFRRQFLGAARSLTAEQAGLARQAKELVFEALLEAVDRGIPSGGPAILVDLEYGAGVIRAARASAVKVVVPIEVSGRDELELIGGDRGFGAVVEQADADYVKVLVRYHPEGDSRVNGRQRDRLALLQTWLETQERDWMLELLVPPAPGERGTEGFDRDGWDRTRRPGLTIDAIDEMAGSGLRPRFWKLEGMPSSEAYAAVAAATQSSGRSESRCLVLGRGADRRAVEAWLRLAAPLPAYGGFAVGRTLWWEPLRAWIEAGCSPAARAQAANAIACNYRQLIDIYLEATKRAV